MNTMKEYIDEAERDLLHTYNRYQVVFDHGEGVRLFDLEGKSYLDFICGCSPEAMAASRSLLDTTTNT